MTASAAGVSFAGTTTDPPLEQPGDVVRDSALTLEVDPGGRQWLRTNSNPAYNPLAPAQAGSALLGGCVGDNPDGIDNSPRSHLEVTDPDGDIVLAQTSPAKVVNLLSPDYDKPVNPQPVPSNTNWRGGEWATTLDLAGRAPGTYTVTTTITNKVRSTVTGDTLACTTGTPNPGANTAGDFTPGPVVETFTFEYRPWAERFDDLLGGGSIRLNLSPRELTYTVGGARSSLITGAAGEAAMTLLAVPDAGTFALPGDPASCADDPASCLPPGAQACDPAEGCTPRLALLNHSAPGETLVGLIDLQTRAFVALAEAGGVTRVLASGGTDVDAVLLDGLADLLAIIDDAGIDLAQLLAQPVTLRIDESGTTRELTVSLLEGIQLTTKPTDPQPGGGTTAAAGLIVHIGMWSGPDLGQGQGSGYGYTLREASVLPAIPAGLPAPVNVLLSGGKVRHVLGTVPPGGGQHVIVLSADTEPGEPNGLPVWIPIVSGATTAIDNGVEFVGDDLLVIDFELCLAGTCGGAGTLVGTGLALFPANPINGTTSIAELPLLWTECSTGLETTCPEGPIPLIAEVDGVIADVTADVLGNPVVEEVLSVLDPIVGPLLDEALADVPLMSGTTSSATTFQASEPAPNLVTGVTRLVSGLFGRR